MPNGVYTLVTDIEHLMLSLNTMQYEKSRTRVKYHIKRKSDELIRHYADAFGLTKDEVKLAANYSTLMLDVDAFSELLNEFSLRGDVT